MINKILNNYEEYKLFMDLQGQTLPKLIPIIETDNMLPPFSALDLHLPLPLKAPAFPHGNAGTRHRSFSFLPAISRTPSATL